MQVITNNKTVAIEVLSAQDLLNSDEIQEITIKSVSSAKHFMNDYDAEVTIGDLKVVLFRDLDFQNVNINRLLKSNLCNIEFVEI